MNDLPQVLKLMRLAALIGNVDERLKTLAQRDAPNYRPASTINRCGTCRHFVRSTLCELFDFAADPDYICDRWEIRDPNVGDTSA